MKIFKKFFFKIFTSLFLLMGISVPLNSWANNTTSSKKLTDILVAAKAFNKADCKKYLDRDVLSKGYQPIQIIIKNSSNKVLIFSPDQVSLPCARVEQVIEQVHTSTVGRATGYGAAAVLSCGLFAIPAIVDGVKSSNANKALDADYFSKSAKRQIIPPNGKLNGLLFIPIGSYSNSFKITLLEENNNNTHKLIVTTS